MRTMPNKLNSLLKSLSGRRAFLLSFAFGFTLRLIPELLSYPHPVGFDTVMYSAKLHNNVVWKNGAMIFAMGLFEGILALVSKLIQTDPFLLLKITAPILFALNVCGICYFSRQALQWSPRKGFIASTFFAFQLASLRLSWDLQRNLFATAILLFALPLAQLKTKKQFVLLAILSVAIAFTHILVSAILLLILFAQILEGLHEEKKIKTLKLMAVNILVVVAVMANAYLLPAFDYMPENAVSAGDTVHAYPGGLFFMVNYLGVSDPVQNYSSYPELALDVLSLFSLLYMLAVPLVLIGFFRSKILDAWILLALFGSFNSLITPFFALDLWNRWMLMLVYPFTFYAVNGISKLFKSQSTSAYSEYKYVRRVRVSRKTAISLVCVAVVLGSVFATIPPFYDRYGVFLIPPANPYFPTTMLYSTVPIRDVKSVLDTMEWLNRNMTVDSSVLLHRAFLWWADIFLDKKLVIISYVRNVEKALEVAIQRESSSIYVVWWNENYITWQNRQIGWYGLSVPNYFIPVFSSDRITVFRYSVG